MQRSLCENENVQFVQELAEVDGPFESPININFRDLTKLELPSLEWNRSDSFPKKMKITNTGHTVILSGKWKCERPFLTGGPLQGKYVFSQIHFHWGQDDCKGSEHQVCGEGFPLEMHVAHFKTEYLTQECALREKDGMVVVVYLFKLQEEPNAGLKKLLSVLPLVKQPSTSHPVDPRPILSLCNPFKDDYFMYWGSVVTSTCAHILLWLVCREPFGISKDQVNEFRKILDASQQPICRNNREPQPLHKRNVFHVNASKNLIDPLLPVKNILGCFCKGSEDNVNNSTPHDCSCQNYKKHQEEIEGNTAEDCTGSQFYEVEGKQDSYWKPGLPEDFIVRQSITVHNATVHSASLTPKKLESDPITHFCCLENIQKTTLSNSEVNFISKSCCFPLNEVENDKKEPEKKKLPERKRPFESMKAFSHIMDSLEALKSHTFKKLKEIESINQEIRGMETLFQGKEDTRWLRRVEKMLTRQKRFTIKTSQACFSELKKLAKECNFDKFFENKTLPLGDNNNKIVLLSNNEVPSEALPCAGIDTKAEEEVCNVKKIPSKSLHTDKAVTFSEKARKLIQSFFEDIKESDELKESVRRKLQLKKISSLCLKHGGANPKKGMITQKMFTLGNLGDRFFTEVAAEDLEVKKDTETAELTTTQKGDSLETEEIIKIEDLIQNVNEEMIPLHKANIAIEFSRIKRESSINENLMYKDSFTSKEEPGVLHLDILDKVSTSESEAIFSPYLHEKQKSQKSRSKNSIERKLTEEIESLAYENLIKHLEKGSILNFSNSGASTNSTETQRMIIAKFQKRQSRGNIWEENSSLVTKISSKGLYERTDYKRQGLKNINLEGYYLKRKNKKRKAKKKPLSSCDLSSTSVEEIKSQWKRLTKTKFKLEIEKPSDSSLDSAMDSLTSPERKKLKLEYKKMKANVSTRRTSLRERHPLSLTESDTRVELPKKIKHRKSVGSKVKGQQKSEEEVKWMFPKLKDSLEMQKVIKIHIPPNEPQIPTHRTFRGSSVDSQRTYSQEADTLPSPTHAAVGKETQRLPTPKLLTKNRSLSDLLTRPKMDIMQRIFVENISSRRKTARDMTDFKRKKEFEKRKESPRITREDVCRVPSNETYRKSDKGREERATLVLHVTESHSETPQEYNVGFFTTASNHLDEDLLRTTQTVCEIEKHPLIGKALQESKPPSREATQDRLEAPQPIESTKFFSEGPSMKGDAVKVDATKLPPTVSYPLKKNSQSRPHSAESLNSSIKVIKRKGKKRPHCCKRRSRHYIRKNSSIFKKLNKVESKPLNFVSLTEEEQLKIISANVAEYLKQKLVEHSQKSDDSEKSCSFREIKEAVIKQLESEVKERELPQKEEEAAEKEITVVKIADLSKPLKMDPQKEEKYLKVPEKEKKPTSPSRPVHNFIKLNKLMAGKYRRSAPSTDRKAETSLKKKDEQKPVTKAKAPNKKKKIPSPERIERRKPNIAPTSQRVKENNPPAEHKENNPKSGNSPKKIQKEPPETSKEVTKCEGGYKDGASNSLALRKIPQVRKRWIPAYMITSYLPTPIEVIKNQQMKMNRCLLNPKKGGSFLPEVMYESKNSNTYMKGKEKETLFKKDLEYLIRLQMCLSNEISTNLENSMNYVKTLLSQDTGTAIIEKGPIDNSLDIYEPNNKGLVLIEMKDHLDGSTSGSDLLEDSTFFRLSREFSSKHKLSAKELSKVKIPKESGDTGIINPPLMRDFEDGYNSDSSYNCEISITLNAGATEDEGEMQVIDPNSYCDEFSNCTYDLWRESNISQVHLDDRNSSQSIVLRHNRKKRKESEISTEMKQKLLEILEDEIRREMAVSYGLPSEDSSEGLALLWDDSDVMDRSESAESNNDNMDIMTQISETMRQYLSDFKERRLLLERKEEAEESESRDEDES